jgi:hypothetical protein
MDIAREKILEAHFDVPGAALRPIMTSLNGDNSWLLSFPRPKPERQAAGKAYYHIVFEPWLNGPTSQFSSWLIHIRLAIAPAVTDVESIAAIIRQIEAAAAKVTEVITATPKKEEEYNGEIDAILLSFHYLDHIHEPTLRLFDSRTPVIATPEAAALIKPWNHFTDVHHIPNLDVSVTSWRTPDLHPGGLPSWLTVIRLPGHMELNFVTALVWTHLAEDDNEIHEVIFHTPHGTRLDEGPLQTFLDSEPQTEKLSLMHGLKEGYAGGTMATLGVKSGLALYRRIGGVKYWVQTHHSTLWYSGIIMRTLWVYDTPRTLQWALEKEALDDSVEKREGGKPSVINVDNGGCLVLE